MMDMFIGNPQKNIHNAKVQQYFLCELCVPSRFQNRKCVEVHKEELCR